jgi:hypothetical protein
MARGGYRTLLISDRELGRDEYEKWQVAYLAASVRHTASGQASPQLATWLNVDGMHSAAADPWAVQQCLAMTP